MIDHHHLFDLVERRLEEWAGPLAAWVVAAWQWFAGGSSPIAAAGSVVALVWTVERIKTERTKRRLMIQKRDDEMRVAGELLHALTRPFEDATEPTEPMRLDPGEHK